MIIFSFIKMGILEQNAKQNRRRRYVQYAILTVILVAGAMVWTAVAPNTLQLLGGFGRRKSRFNYQAKSALSRLAQKGHVRFISKDDKRYVEITESGRRAIALEEHRASLLTSKKRWWDKRWRLVMFDIPERRKNVRRQLRIMMSGLGFLRLQDSVWVYPYDCEELVALLKAELHIGKDVLYAIVEQLENDVAIKKHFGLPA